MLIYWIGDLVVEVKAMGVQVEGGGGISGERKSLESARGEIKEKERAGG